mmetsp:Transcript_23821/g.81843  ORF Transcript_23821/g.81843 Transcript_23821/m.81843 type:complete len:221 (+) Transcript_23821:969-1631(+)
MESVKQIFFAPTLAMAASTFFMPPMVMASAIAGFSAVSTDSGAARFQTDVFASACSSKSLTKPSASVTSTEPMQMPFSPMESRRSLGSTGVRSVAMTLWPACVSAAQSRLPTAPAAPMMSVDCRRFCSLAMAFFVASRSASDAFRSTADRFCVSVMVSTTLSDEKRARGAAARAATRGGVTAPGGPSGGSPPRCARRRWRRRSTPRRAGCRRPRGTSSRS